MCVFCVALFLKGTTLAFPLGTTTSAVAVELAPGQTACQLPVDVPEYGAFDRLVVQLGTFGRRGPGLEVTVTSLRDSVARGRLVGGYPDVNVKPRHVIRFGKMIRGRRLKICLRNVGPSRVAIYGSGDNASRSSTARLDGTPVHRDMNLEFRRPARTYASLLGSILERAALFRSPVMTGTVYAVVLSLLAFAAATALFTVIRETSDRS